MIAVGLAFHVYMFYGMPRLQPDVPQHDPEVFEAVPLALATEGVGLLGHRALVSRALCRMT